MLGAARPGQQVAAQRFLWLTIEIVRLEDWKMTALMRVLWMGIVLFSLVTSTTLAAHGHEQDAISYTREALLMALRFAGTRFEAPANLPHLPEELRRRPQQQFWQYLLRRELEA